MATVVAIDVPPISRQSSRGCGDGCRNALGSEPAAPRRSGARRSIPIGTPSSEATPSSKDGWESSFERALLPASWLPSGSFPSLERDPENSRWVPRGCRAALVAAEDAAEKPSPIGVPPARDRAPLLVAARARVGNRCGCAPRTRLVQGPYRIGGSDALDRQSSSGVIGALTLRYAERGAPNPDVVSISAASGLGSECGKADDRGFLGSSSPSECRVGSDPTSGRDDHGAQGRFGGRLGPRRSAARARVSASDRGGRHKRSPPRRRPGEGHVGREPLCALHSRRASRRFLNRLHISADVRGASTHLYEGTDRRPWPAVRLL